MKVILIRDGRYAVQNFFGEPLFLLPLQFKFHTMIVHMRVLPCDYRSKLKNEIQCLSAARLRL